MSVRAALVAVLATTPAAAGPHDTQVVAELGAAVVPATEGEHEPALVSGVRIQQGVSSLFALALAYDFGLHHEGDAQVHYSLRTHRIALRAELALGEGAAKFYAGAGPALFLANTALSDAMTSTSGTVTSVGLLGALGLRWTLGAPVIGVELCAARHDGGTDLSAQLLGGVRF